MRYRHWPGKTITEYDDHLFCMITMNHHPLHTNDWFAAESVQGRNVVVGNLVYSLVLGMSVPDVSGAAIANLEVETLQHKFPTFHGDTIHAETRVVDVKESSSKPDRGVVTVETKGFNQDGKEVCYFRRKVLIWKRDAAPERTRPYDGVDVWADDVLWDLVYSAAQVPEQVEPAGETLELSLLARAAFDLAQKFSTFYNQHPMLQEEDAGLRAARLAATRIFAGALEGLLELLGITVPERM